MNELPERYEAWLAYLFEHPNDRKWYFTQSDDVEPFRAANCELIALITHTCLRCGEDLLPYTEAEIADGLSYIFHNGISDTIFSFRDASVPLDERLAAVHSIKTLYRDCLDPRCAPVLGHLDQPGAVRSTCSATCSGM